MTFKDFQKHLLLLSTVSLFTFSSAFALNDTYNFSGVVYYHDANSDTDERLANAEIRVSGAVSASYFANSNGFFDITIEVAAGEIASKGLTFIPVKEGYKFCYLADSSTMTQDCDGYSTSKTGGFSGFVFTGYSAGGEIPGDPQTIDSASAKWNGKKVTFKAEVSGFNYDEDGIGADWQITSADSVTTFASGTLEEEEDDIIKATFKATAAQIKSNLVLIVGDISKSVKVKKVKKKKK